MDLINDRDLAPGDPFFSLSVKHGSSGRDWQKGTVTVVGMAALAPRGPLLRIFALDHELGQLLAEAMAAAPLRPDEFAVYSWLYVSGSKTPSELAAETGLRQTTLSNLVNRMFDRGHVSRVKNPDDGRSVVVSLRAAGRRATEKSYPYFDAALTAFLDGLDIPIEEIDRVLGSLERAMRVARNQFDVSTINAR